MEAKHQLKLPKYIRAQKYTKDEKKEKYVFVTQHGNSLHGILVLKPPTIALTTVWSWSL